MELLFVWAVIWIGGYFIFILHEKWYEWKKKNGFS